MCCQRANFRKKARLSGLTFEFVDLKVWLTIMTRALINLVVVSGHFLFFASNLDFSLTDKADRKKSANRASTESSKHATSKNRHSKASVVQITALADAESVPPNDIAKDINGAQAEERSTGDTSNGANAVNDQNPLN